jgi:acyl-CoA synthetase (NDP forming)
MQLLKSTSRRKPIVVLKSGRTAAGVKAASSHSGALIKESDTVFDAALRQSGVIRAQTIGEFFDFAKAFEYLGPLNKNRIVVATLSGGEGVLTTDLCQQSGFSMAELSQSSFRKLKSIFPPWEIPINPFDLGVCAEFNRMDEVYNVVLDAMVSDQNMDCLAIQMMPIGLPDDVLKSFLKAKERKKHLVTWVPEPLCGKDKLIQWLETNRIPVYSSAEGAIKALSALYRYSIMQAAIY